MAEETTKPDAAIKPAAPPEIDPNRIYVIGDKAIGVLFIRLEPLRVSLLSRTELLSDVNGDASRYDEVFGKMAGDAQMFINNCSVAESLTDEDAVYEAFATLIGRGTPISDTAFCFTGQMKPGKWESDRIPSVALDSVANLQDNRDKGKGGATYLGLTKAPPLPTGQEPAADKPKP